MVLILEPFGGSLVNWASYFPCSCLELILFTYPKAVTTFLSVFRIQCYNCSFFFSYSLWPWGFNTFLKINIDRNRICIIQNNVYCYNGVWKRNEWVCVQYLSRTLPSLCTLVLSPLAEPQTPWFSLSQKYNSLIPLSS